MNDPTHESLNNHIVDHGDNYLRCDPFVPVYATTKNDPDKLQACYGQARQEMKAVSCEVEYTRQHA